MTDFTKVQQALERRGYTVRTFAAAAEAAAYLDGAIDGKTVGFGAIDSPQATLIPLDHLRQAGLVAGKDYTAHRFDVLGGKHGDHIGGEREAAKLGVPLLGKIPLDISTRSGGDEGRPVALEDPEQNPVSAAFRQVAEQCARVVLDR